MIRSESEVVAEETLPGPYKIDPLDGNAFRIDSYPTQPYGTGYVTVTDCLGTHKHDVSIEKWMSWENSE
jgi:hypothetical protein